MIFQSAQERAVHWTRDACELFRGKQLTDFFVPLSVVSLGGDLCNGKSWWGYWLSESVFFTSSAGPSHKIYIVLKGQARISGHLQQLPYLSFWTWADRANSGVKTRAGSSHPTLPFQAVLADWSWESEVYPTCGNLLLCRYNIHVQICSPCLLVLGSSAPQLFLLHFILPCRRQLSGCHLLPDTCWNETCCSSTDPVCLGYRVNLESRLQGT